MDCGAIRFISFPAPYLMDMIMWDFNKETLHYQMRGGNEKSGDASFDIFCLLQEYVLFSLLFFY